MGRSVSETAYATRPDAASSAAIRVPSAGEGTRISTRIGTAVKIASSRASARSRSAARSGQASCEATRTITRSVTRGPPPSTPAPLAPAHAAASESASVSRSTTRSAQDRVAVVAVVILDAADDHLVGAERDVAFRKAAALQVRRRVARREVELLVDRIALIRNTHLEAPDRHEAARARLAGNGLDEDCRIHGSGFAGVPDLVVPFARDMPYA